MLGSFEHTYANITCYVVGNEGARFNQSKESSQLNS